MGTPLSTEEIQRALAELPGWAERDRALEKAFTFASFSGAMRFMALAAAEAEALDHHPEWTNIFNRVIVRLCTHDAGSCITAKDIELGRRFEKLRHNKKP